MNCPDRTTNLGGVISSYLKGATEMKDEVIHLLFSANRWEKEYYIAFHILK
jgi:dTMP kinase